MGEVPHGWELHHLDDPRVCTINPKKSEVANLLDSTPVTFVPMACVDEVSGKILDPPIKTLGEVRRGFTYFRENDVVFAKITPCMENGKSAVARNLENKIGFGTTEFHVLRPGPLVIPEWIHFFIRQQSLREAAKESMCGGAGQQRVPASFLKKVRIPLPPLKEQRKIVSRIEALTRRSEKSIYVIESRETELDHLIQSMYSQMVADTEWKPLGTVASLVRRKVEMKPEEQYEEMGVRSFGKGTFKKPVLTGKQIGKKRIYRIHEGDLVFNNVFAWEGAIAVAQRDDHDRVGSHRFITYLPKGKKATSEFLCHHFLSAKGLEDISAASPGSAGRNRTLGLEKLDKIMVPVPDFSEQVRFERVAKIRRKVAGISSESIQGLKKLIPSILAKAFKGEL